MEFELEKHISLVMKRGKIVYLDGIELLDNKTLSCLQADKMYRYLCVQQSDDMNTPDMKESVSKKV